jgi:hypothetical protein
MGFCQVLAWSIPDDSRGGVFNQNAGRIIVQADGALRIARKKNGRTRRPFFRKRA